MNEYGIHQIVQKSFWNKFSLAGFFPPSQILRSVPLGQAHLDVGSFFLIKFFFLVTVDIQYYISFRYTA